MVNKFLIRFISLKICKALSIVNRLIRKNENIILFFTNIPGFNDNNRALYEYLISNHYNDKYKIVISIPDYRVKKFKITNVIFVSPIVGLLYFLVAKYCFFDGGTYKVKPSNNQCVVSLWHGTPLKKIGRNVEKSLRIDRYNDFTKIVCTSDNLIHIFSESFECKKNDVLVLGYPRNDNLFDKNDYINLFGLNKSNYKKSIIWMPTFRKSINGRYNTNTGQFDNRWFPLFENEQEMDQLNVKLKEIECLLFIKLHPLAIQNSYEYFSYSNLLVVNNEIMNKVDIQNYKLLSNFDALITDYSSVYFDYLLLDRPVAFVVNDIKNYRNQRGFTFENPIDLMPGDFITNKNNFYSFLDSVIAETDNYRKSRHDVNDFINTYKDNNSSYRILNYCGIMK